VADLQDWATVLRHMDLTRRPELDELLAKVAMLVLAIILLGSVLGVASA